MEDSDIVPLLDVHSVSLEIYKGYLSTKSLFKFKATEHGSYLYSVKFS